MILDNEMFSDIALTSRHEGDETAEAKSKKLCDKVQVECFSKLLNFLILQSKSVFSFQVNIACRML